MQFRDVTSKREHKLAEALGEDDPMLYAGRTCKFDGKDAGRRVAKRHADAFRFLSLKRKKSPNG